MYKKTILSVFAISTLYSSEILLPQVNVKATTPIPTQNIQTSSNITGVLTKSFPSIDMSRRGGVANDILIRGQKRDNITIDIDGMKLYGAGPNRMDPPISNVLVSQIKYIDIIEGPYDVENFGTLSGGIKVKTKQPNKKMEGSINVDFGSFNYKKFGATISGGNNNIKVLLTSSTESSAQYRDGNGDTLIQQTKKRAPLTNQYRKNYEDLEAYKKRSLNGKFFINLTSNQEIKLDYTTNKATNVLYPNGPMDASYDNSDIYSISYNANQLSQKYKRLNLKYYYSSAQHSMSTKYRNSSKMSTMDITNALTSSVQGIKLKNSLLLSTYKILIGLDTSKRNWFGKYLNTTSNLYKADSISNTKTYNRAIFFKLSNSYKNFDISMATRYDSTQINNDKTLQNKNYSALNVNITSTYYINGNNKFFLGIGKASRVPDARELYFEKAGKLIGTPTLNQTTNSEIDVAYETNNYDFKFKVKMFYSILNDYIYIKKGATTNAFYNIDATLYGTEVSGSYYMNDNISLDMIASYKRGRKDSPLSYQTDKDLADIAPLRGNIALNYEYKKDSTASLELEASDKWDNIDSDNGEQTLEAWAIINMKLKHTLNKKCNFTIGINNLLNKTYALSNTYADLTLLVTGANEAMLLNEPGRYIYTNLNFKF